MALVVVLLLIAVATGRANAIFAIIGAAIAAAWRMAPLLLRFAPQLKGLFKQFTGSPATAPDSSVSTRSLVMTLDHSTGEFDGRITTGDFEGRNLSSLSLTELQQFAKYCQHKDPEAIKLVSAFAARYRPDWPFESQPGHSANTGDMSTDEALSILGLESNASEEDIVLAHRKLMAKLHPDKGGSDYLATKINQAKDYLIKHRKTQR